MKKFILPLLGVLVINPLNAFEYKGYDISIEPYVGTNIGVQIGVNSVYFGLNHSFVNNGKDGDGMLKNINSVVFAEHRITNIFNLNAGYSTQKFFIGPQIGLDKASTRITSDYPVYDYDAKDTIIFVYGIQGGYYFDNNIFIRGDINYSGGIDKVKTNIPSNDTFTPNRKTGSGFIANLSIGYRF